MNLMQVMESAMSLRVCLTVIYVLTSSTSRGQSSEVNYGILLDAGSTSSKLNIYKWTPPASTGLLPGVELLINEKYEPPISAFEGNVTGLTSYLKEIINKTKQTIPAARYTDTPMYLLATAGLRFLTASDARIFLGEIRTVLADKDLNPYMYSPSWVSILSGEEEGIYSWIAANYLLGVLNKQGSTNGSVGVLEMGGSSTQITFLPNDPIFSEEYQVVLAGRYYQLYVQSYLMFGSTAIKLKIANFLSQQDPSQEEIENPCLLKGDGSNSTKLENGTFVKERGSGSPSQCLKILREILRPNTDTSCYPKPCAIGSVYQASVENIQFYATQAYLYSPEALKVGASDSILNISKLEEAAVTFCNGSIDEAESKYGMDKSFASDNCLMGLYIPTLLTLSYGFSRNTTNIKLAKSIGQTRIDWSLGAMLVELSTLFGSRWSRYEVTCKTTDVHNRGRGTDARGDNQTVLLLVVLLSFLLE